MNKMDSAEMVPKRTMYFPAANRMQRKLPIGMVDWTQESHDSEERSRCNTITFGSNNPRSRDSASALENRKMLIKGRKLIK